LSSDAARRPLQICHEALEDSIGDAPLEASQRFLTGLALRHLLAIVGSAPNVRPGLVDGDHVQLANRTLPYFGPESRNLLSSEDVLAEADV
jgi:hypothetical protein